MRQRRCVVSGLAVLLIFAAGMALSQQKAVKDKPKANTKATPPQTVEQQITVIEGKMKRIESLLGDQGVRDDAVLGPELVDQWAKLSCHAKRLEAGQLLAEMATKAVLERMEANCVAERKPQAEMGFLGARVTTTPPRRSHMEDPFAPVDSGNGRPPSNGSKNGKGSASPGGKEDPKAKLAPTEFSSGGDKRSVAASFPIKSDSIVLEDKKDDKACNPKDKLCITLDWQAKSPTAMPLRKSGDFTFHAVNLNDILYQYTMTGEAPTPATDDLAALAAIIKKTPSSVLALDGSEKTKSSDSKGPATANLVKTTCELGSLKTNWADAQAQLRSMDQAVKDLQPQATDKKYASIALEETKSKVRALVDAFNSLTRAALRLQDNLKDTKIGGDCSEVKETLDNASDFITDQYPKIRGQVERLRDRFNQPHTLDQVFHCEQTIGCSMSIQESYAGTPTTATPNPWKSTQQATLSQLTVSGGFLLTTLQARSYSSRTAPDPAAPTTKTVNVLGVDDGSGVRPALTALLNYHLPFSFTDWPKGGFALSAGPVIDVSNGKADTSRFGFFGGVSAHLWNRFWVTPGVHVGEFADTPQGFKGAGDIIPPNIGTPTPVKRFTARFAVAVTFQGGSPSALVGDKKTDTTKDTKPAPGNGKAATPGNN